MATVTPSKFMSLTYLQNLASNHYTGKNGKEYEIAEVNALIWAKQTALPQPKPTEIPESYRVEHLSNSDLDTEIEVAKIFQDNIIGELLMEKALRLGKYTQN